MYFNGNTVGDALNTIEMIRSRMIRPLLVKPQSPFLGVLSIDLRTLFSSVDHQTIVGGLRSGSSHCIAYSFSFLEHPRFTKILFNTVVRYYMEKHPD